MSSSNTTKSLVFVAALAASTVVATNPYPTVTAHGMGDSCFNEGMKDITDLVGKTTGSYAKCIPTGSNEISDTANGFFMTMNKNVYKFAENIRKDQQLAN